MFGVRIQFRSDPTHTPKVQQQFFWTSVAKLQFYVAQKFQSQTNQFTEHVQVSRGTLANYFCEKCRFLEFVVGNRADRLAHTESSKFLFSTSLTKNKQTETETEQIVLATPTLAF